MISLTRPSGTSETTLALAYLPRRAGHRGSQIPSKDAQIREIMLKAKKAAVLLDATNELLADARASGRLLQGTMADAARAGLEAALLTGDGIGGPRGVLNDPALVTVNPVAGQTADTINFENLVGMVAHLHPALLPDAIWVASPSCMAQLFSLAFPVKNVAGSENVGGERASAKFDAGRRTFSLLGMPLYFSESLPTLCDKGDILLIAPSQFAYGLRRDISVQADTSQKFDYDMTRFRMTPAAGATLSWCVALAAR